MNTITEQMNCEAFRENMKRFDKLGYRWKITPNGYQVWHGEEYLGGAGTIPRSRHYSHCRADVVMYTSIVYSMIQKHRQLLKDKTVRN